MIRLDALQGFSVARHAHSVGNALRSDAEARGLMEVETDLRDRDYPLTAQGRAEAQALATRIAALPQPQRPTAIVCSPYARALETADYILRRGLPGQRVRFNLDERLRPKNFGITERLTTHGIAHRLPSLLELRRTIPSFHFCPPQGESRCDVVRRTRDFLKSLVRTHAGERVLLIAHKPIVNSLDYLLTPLGELAFSAEHAGSARNAELTMYATRLPSRVFAAHPNARDLVPEHFEYATAA
ncbi:MAG: histidine phosphatase family protein [Tahibacter sp.]